MKKFRLVLFATMFAFLGIFLSACSEEKSEFRYVNMETYFNSVVYREDLESSSAVAENLSDFQEGLVEAFRLNSITLSCDTDWSAELFVNKFFFDIVANDNCEISMSVVLGGVENGETSGSSSVKKTEKLFSVVLKQNIAQTICVELNDKFEETLSYIVVGTNNTDAFYLSGSDNLFNNLLVKVSNFQLLGGHLD